MSDPTPKRRQGFWLTVGEGVGALALVIAGLNYWDSRKQHAEETHRLDTTARAQAAFVVTGQASGDGRRIDIQALKPTQAIESQRYIFPRAVLDHPMEVTAARPQIDLGWIEDGLRKAPRAVKSGERTLPVAIVTTYVEDGETRSDTSIYRLGYGWKTGLLGGAKFHLQGLSLSRRAVRGDPRVMLET